MTYFAVILPALNPELGPVYLEAHIAYLDRLRSEGKVAANGRLLDGPGGLVIYKGDSLEEVKLLVEQDPFIIHKVRSFEIYEWAVKWAEDALSI
ncbi:YciI family protein [Paenibacillus eucommiae]|uniref:Uncharacterized protein YciI n=1 Tax=Paenibacillus eucommiae TaxID=1355755 RepID=A0ABS4J934_9BACL|nr:YciI family protein [Paenibacillus eucommiae]MBP1996350.1 uncharacterized protein YciI [Paenibacillus eucommiae]